MHPAPGERQLLGWKTLRRGLVLQERIPRLHAIAVHTEQDRIAPDQKAVKHHPEVLLGRPHRGEEPLSGALVLNGLLAYQPVEPLKQHRGSSRYPIKLLDDLETPRCGRVQK